jgi:HEAT repeat protein
MSDNHLGKPNDQRVLLKETASSDEVLVGNDSAVLRRVLDHLSRCSGIESPTDETRREVAAALCAIAPDAVAVAENALVTYIQGSVIELSIRAMTALRSIVSPSTPMLRALSAAICHENRSIRIEAFQAVRHVGKTAPPSVQSLIDTLKRELLGGHKNNAAILSVARALGEIGPAAVHALPLLFEASEIDWGYDAPYEDEFVDHSMASQERSHRKWIEDIESVIHKIGALAIPIQVWSMREGWGAERLITLGRVIGPPAALPLEIALSAVDPKVRMAAAEALGRTVYWVKYVGHAHPAHPTLPAFSAFSALIVALRNQQEEDGVRIAAAEAIRCFVSQQEAGTTALDAVSALSTVLSNPKEGEGVRIAAARTLSCIAPSEGAAMVSALSTALADENMSVRLYAAEGLVLVGRNEPPILSLVPPLLKVVAGVASHSDYKLRSTDVRCGAIGALAEMGMVAAPLAVPALIRELDGEDPHTVSRAVWALKWFGASSSLEIATLRERLRGSASRNRWKTADVLSGIPGGATVLMETLDDEQVEVRRCAAKAIQQIDPNDKDLAIPALIKALGNTDDDVRNAVATVLGDRAPKSFPALIRTLRKGDGSNRATIAWGLSRMLETIPSDRLHECPVALLLKACHDRAADVRQYALALLLQRNGFCEQPLKILREALRDEDQRIRRFAVATFARSGPSAVPDLIKALLDDDDEVRLDAIAGLAALGHEAAAATTPLARLLGDRSPTIRKAAADAIARIGPLESEFGQRMRSEAIQEHKKLHVFRLIGEILIEQGVDTMPFGKLVQFLEDRYQQELSQNTLRNYRDDVNDLFRVYRGEPEPRYEDREHRVTTVNEEVDFFDRRQGRPFRMLKKGWESWGETKLYFAVLEGELKDLI